MGNHWVQDSDETGHWEDDPAPDPNVIQGVIAPTRESTTDMGSWGHRGNDVVSDGTNKYVDIGTSGMNRDVDRYRHMGGAPVNPYAPTAAGSNDQTRDMGMGALALLRARAEGGATPAQDLSRRTTTGAINAIQSGAASMKGGAGARAAAARTAGFAGARIQAQGNQDTAALAAREKADAAGQYFGAATGQRGVDIGLATENAKLRAGENALNDNREAFYEGLSQDTQQSQLNHMLGRNEAESAAAAGAFNTGMARDAADREATRSQVSTGAAIGQGVISGVQNAQGGQQAPAGSTGPRPGLSTRTDPYTDDGTSSDEKTKKRIKPVTNAEADRLANDALSWVPNAKTTFRDGATVGAGARARVRDAAKQEASSDYDGKYLPSPFQTKPDVISGADAQTKPMDLQTAIAHRVAADNAAEPRYGYFDEEEGGSKRPLYVRENPYGEGEKMLSDKTAKAAFLEGADYGLNHAKGTTLPLPEYARTAQEPEADRMTGPRGKVGASPGGRAASRSVEKPTAKPLPEETNPVSDAYFGAVNATAKGFDKAVDSPALDFLDEKRGPKQIGPRTAYVDRPAMTYSEKIEQQFGGPPQRETTPSDDRTKIQGIFGAPNKGPTHLTRASEQAAGDESAARERAEAKQYLDSKDNARDAKDFMEGRFGKTISDEKTKDVDSSSRMDKLLLRTRKLPGKVGEALDAAGKRLLEFRASVTKKPEPPVRDLGELDELDKSTSSDRQAKQDVHFGGPMAAANRSMEPKVYVYKPGFAESEGQELGEPNVGPIAQKMKANPVAATAIEEDPQSGLLAIDKAKGLKLVMGGLADLQRQVDALSDKRKERTA